MSTFAQWLAAIDRGDVRRVTWVCGEQRVLVEEVVDTTRKLVDVNELDYLSIRVGEVGQYGMWDVLNQYTSGARRFIVVRDVEKVTYWEPLEGWLADPRLASIHVVFVSSDHDVAHTVVDKKKIAASHIATLMARRRHAVVVRCGTPNPVDAVAWVRRRAWLFDDSVAHHLLVRVGGDLTAAAGIADKLALFDGDERISPATVDQLCDQLVTNTFADSLLMLRRRDALTAAQGLSQYEYGKVIGLLDSRLDLLATLNHHIRVGSHPREMAGVPHFLARAYLPIAKHYDSQRCDRSRQVLALVDDALRSGARDGLMEALVALW
jgi:DNA polymerase III delta subunit